MQFKQARWYTKTTGRSIDLHVIHTMEAPEKGTTAEAVANYFATTSTKASAHYCYDNNSEIQCVYDKDVAYAAPGANHNGLHHELAGYARQTAGEWSDAFSDAMLARAAVNVYEGCQKYNIPIRYVNYTDLVAGRHGITTHNDVSKAFKRSTHTDPGPNFPMTRFIEMVKAVPLLGQPVPDVQQKVVIMNDLVSVRTCPVDGGFQALQRDGAVFNSPACVHYFGSWWEAKMEAERTKFPNTEFRAIEDAPNLGPEHYRCFTSDGRFYEF